MSLLDEVRKLEQQLVSRLKELEPLMREYDQLRQLAQRLGINYLPGPKPAKEAAQPSPPAATPRRAAAKKRTAARSATATKPRATERTARAKRAKPRTSAARTAQGDGAATAAAPSKPATRARRSSAAKRAATRPGQRFDDVLRVVSANPGITVREVGAQLGVDATGLYRVANRLTRDGRVRKDGTRLYAVESGGTAAPDSSAEPATSTATDTGESGATPADADAGGAASPETGTAGSA
jgi:hypothetical protein